MASISFQNQRPSLMMNQRVRPAPIFEENQNHNHHSDEEGDDSPSSYNSSSSESDEIGRPVSLARIRGGGGGAPLVTAEVPSRRPFGQSLSSGRMTQWLASPVGKAVVAAVGAIVVLGSVFVAQSTSSGGSHGNGSFDGASEQIHNLPLDNNNNNKKQGNAITVKFNFPKMSPTDMPTHQAMIHNVPRLDEDVKDLVMVRTSTHDEIKDNDDGPITLYRVAPGTPTTAPWKESQDRKTHGRSPINVMWKFPVDTPTTQPWAESQLDQLEAQKLLQDIKNHESSTQAITVKWKQPADTPTTQPWYEASQSSPINVRWRFRADEPTTQPWAEQVEQENLSSPVTIRWKYPADTPTTQPWYEDIKSSPINVLWMNHNGDDDTNHKDDKSSPVNVKFLHDDDSIYQSGAMRVFQGPDSGDEPHLPNDHLNKIDRKKPGKRGGDNKKKRKKNKVDEALQGLMAQGGGSVMIPNANGAYPVNLIAQGSGTISTEDGQDIPVQYLKAPPRIIRQTSPYMLPPRNVPKGTPAAQNPGASAAAVGGGPNPGQAQLPPMGAAAGTGGGMAPPQGFSMAKAPPKIESPVIVVPPPPPPPKEDEEEKEDENEDEDEDQDEDEDEDADEEDALPNVELPNVELPDVKDVELPNVELPANADVSTNVEELDEWRDIELPADEVIPWLSTEAALDEANVTANLTYTVNADAYDVRHVDMPLGELPAFLKSQNLDPSMEKVHFKVHTVGNHKVEISSMAITTNIDLPVTVSIQTSVEEDEQVKADLSNVELPDNAIPATGGCPSVDETALDDYHGPSGEDEAVYEIFYSNPIQTCGTVVEIGAGNGLHFSKSYFFERALHWKPLLIEASPVEYEVLLKNRGANQHVVHGGFCENESMEFYDGHFRGHNGLGEVLSEEHGDMFFDSSSIDNTLEVPCLDLVHTFAQHGIGHKIDLMYISAKGDALSVIRKMDWTVRVDVWVIEFNGYEDRNDVVRTVLELNDYVPAEWDVRRWCDPYMMGRCMPNEVWLAKGFNPLPVDEGDASDPVGRRLQAVQQQRRRRLMAQQP